MGFSLQKKKEEYQDRNFRPEDENRKVGTEMEFVFSSLLVSKFDCRLIVS
jgi:hypothetical protein